MPVSYLAQAERYVADGGEQVARQQA